MHSQACNLLVFDGRNFLECAEESLLDQLRAVLRSLQENTGCFLEGILWDRFTLCMLLFTPCFTVPDKQFFDVYQCVITVKKKKQFT